MAPPTSTPLNLSAIFLIIALFSASKVRSQEPVEVSPWSWCVARSDASNQALQIALDYACASGADCTPFLPNGLCYLPNTLAAHASYAFNSYYQRKARAPGSCDFGGTAAVSKTDPSIFDLRFSPGYGSCVYPHQLSNAGGAPATAGTSTTPTTTVTPTDSPVVVTGSPPRLLRPPSTTPDYDSPSEGSILESNFIIIISISIALMFANLIS